MKKKFIVVFAVCLAAILIFAGCKIVNRHDRNSETTEGNTVQIANPLVEYASKEEAEKAVGFAVTLPKELDSLKLKYRVINGKILEISGEMNGNEINIRKAAGSEDISGDYNSYEVIITSEISSREVTMKGNPDGFCLAVWTQDGYSYSINTPAVSESALTIMAAQLQ